MSGRSVASETPLLLGLDIGSSGGRAVLFDAEGQLVAQANQAWATRFPRPDWAELDAEALWTATARLVRSACDRAAPGRVVGTHRVGLHPEGFSRLPRPSGIPRRWERLSSRRRGRASMRMWSRRLRR